MKAPYTLENQLWNGICSGDKSVIDTLCSRDSLVLLNGNCVENYGIADLLSTFLHCSFSVSYMEVISADNGIMHTVYELTVKSSQDKKEYIVSSVWDIPECVNDDDQEQLNSLSLITESFAFV